VERLAGNVLRVARARTGMSQRELAEAAGVPQSTIARIEFGVRQPSLPLLARILAARSPRRVRRAVAHAGCRSEPVTGFDPRRIVKVLNRHHVEYVLVGSYAAQLYGARRPTYDVDITPSTSQENLQRLAAE
jgi:transcriptional regulator with XRE-family HTH domain